MGIKSGHLFVIDDNKDKRTIPAAEAARLSHPAVRAVNGSRVFLKK